MRSMILPQTPPVQIGREDGVREDGIPTVQVGTPTRAPMWYKELKMMCKY